jgi:hypothetical protein
MERPMVFWKKRIELPTTFYQAAGNCFLYFMESQTKVQKVKASFMTVNNACDLLDLVKEGFTKLAGLITIFPLKSDQLIAQVDVTEDIQTCERRKNALLSMTAVAPSEPLSSFHTQIDGYDTLQFQRSVINMQTILGLQIRKAAKLMAKAANMGSSEFITLVMQAAAATSRGQDAYAEAVRLQNTE